MSADIQDSIFIFDQSSPDSLRIQAQAQAPTVSPPLHSRYTSTSENLTPDFITSEDSYFAFQKPAKQCPSSRSSISSFPASVVHHTPFTDNEDAVGKHTPSKKYLQNRATPPPGHYLSAFRNSSSVKALQLDSELEYADSDALSNRDRSSHLYRSPKSTRPSYFHPRSPGSTQSSPIKRSSRPATPRQQSQQSSSKLKKEFPLVLLHCTLLPPTVVARGPLVSDEILEAVLPEEYRKRWRMLQDKVRRNNEVQRRGVLIPHPREDYEVLEEKLLETLELERPRIRRGHYLGESKSSRAGSGSDSGFESSSQNGSEEGLEPADKDDNRDVGERCPDCGTTVSCKVEQERKWEVKVFAANGLMKGGAWATAWEEMEKVDVEVGVWMPEDVRSEVEERLKALQAKAEDEKPVEEPMEAKRKRRTRSNTAKTRHDERMREIYGESAKPKTQDEIDGLFDSSKGQQSPPSGDSTTEQSQTPKEQPAAVPSEPRQPYPHTRNTAISHGIVQLDLTTLIRYRLSRFFHDQKNLAILLLSILVLVFSIQNTILKLDTTKEPQIPVPTAQAVSITTSAVLQPSIVSEVPSVSYITTTVIADASSAPALGVTQHIIEAAAQHLQKSYNNDSASSEPAVEHKHSTSKPALSTKDTATTLSSPQINDLSSHNSNPETTEDLETCQHQSLVPHVPLDPVELEERDFRPPDTDNSMLPVEESFCISAETDDQLEAVLVEMNDQVVSKSDYAELADDREGTSTQFVPIVETISDLEEADTGAAVFGSNPDADVSNLLSQRNSQGFTSAT